MSDDYTPTTEEVRDGYVKQMTHWAHSSPSGKFGAEFDRWIASVKAEAWDEGYDEPRECCGLCPTTMCPWDGGQGGPINFYRKETPDESP